MNSRLAGRILAAGALALPFTPSSWAQAEPSGTQGQTAGQGDASSLTRAFDIPAQPLGQAVLVFARQAGVDLYIGDVDLSPYTSAPLQGSHSITGGLTRLLGDSPVGYRYRPAEGGGRLNVQLFDNGQGARSHVYSMGAVVVEGKALDQWVYEAPRAVSVITREDMDRTPARHAADLIQDTPGVASAVSRQNPGLSVNIRGMQDFGRVNMMIDGMRQNFVQNGHMQRNGEMYVDSELLSDVVVERGVRSGVHSTGALAGSIDFRSLDFADVLREGKDVGVRLRGNTGLGGEGNGVHFLGSAAGAARVGDSLELLVAYSRRSIGDYRIGTRGGNDQNMGWVDGGLTTYEDVKFASQRQNSNLFKARWQLNDAQSIQFSYIGTRVGYSNVTDANNSLQDSGTPWRSLGTSRVQSDSYALDYKLRPAGNNWVDLNFKLYGVDTRNRNYTDPVYPRTVFGLTDPEAIRVWVDGAWSRGNCEAEEIVATYQETCRYALGTDQRIRTKTFGVQLDNTSRFNLGRETSFSANYGIEYFRDRADSAVQLDHNGRDVDRYNPYGRGDPLNPQGRRSMGSIFTNLTLADDFYTVSAALRYERYWLKGSTQVPGTHNLYQSRFDRFVSAMCSGTSATHREGCAVGQAGDEQAAAAWMESKDRRGYWSNNLFTPAWKQVDGLYDRDVDRSAGKLLPSFSAAIRPTQWLELYASWGKSWRPPAINEALMVGGHPGDNSSFMYPNPNAEPETSRTWELGANTIFQNVATDGDRLSLKLGYFDTKADNYLFSSMNNNTPGRNMDTLMGLGKVTFVNNRTRTRFRGLEFEGRYDAGWIYGGLSYTHYIGGPNKFCQDLYFSGSGSSIYDQPNEDGSYTPQRQSAMAQGYDTWQSWADAQVACGNFVFNSAIAKPVDKGMALVGVRLLERKLDTGVRFTYSGDGWYNRDAGGSQVWFKYTTWDWYASYQATDNIKLMAAVENLTNRMYRDGYSDALARTYAPGRTATIGMELRF